MTPSPSVGLDTATLRALTRPHVNEHQLVDRVAAHLADHDGYVAFSGGKDSLAVLHLAIQAEPNLTVCFFDSGLEFPETLTYVDQVCDLFSVELAVYPASPSLLDLLIADGSWNHCSPFHNGSGRDVRKVLIDRPAELAHTDLGPGELWGVRSAEARGRAQLFRTALAREISDTCTTGCCTSAREQRLAHGGVVRRGDETVAFSPIWDWTTTQVWEYIARNQLPVNPVYAKLTAAGAPAAAHRVSSILSGAHLDTGRVVWLRHGWPDLYELLRTTLPRITELA